MACVNRDVNIVKILLDAGAKFEFGDYILHHVCSSLIGRDCRDIIYLLADSGVKLEKDFGGYYSIRSILQEREINRMKEIIANQSKYIEEIETKILYQPGGQGYEEAKHHFMKHAS